MTIDPVGLASVTAAVSVLGNEYLKGLATETGKASWAGIKALLGWTSDPSPGEIPRMIADKITSSPDITEKLLLLLNSDQSGTASAIVGRIDMTGGKIVVANTIVTDRFQM